jgi:hypothetical protein
VHLLVRAWHELHSCRPQGFSGAGLIPWTAIIEWCRFRGLDREATLLVVDVIRKLDHDRAEREASRAAHGGG